MNDAPTPPPGSRLENARMLLALLTDLASTPWHLAVFVFTRGRARRQLLAALTAEVRDP